VSFTEILSGLIPLDKSDKCKSLQDNSFTTQAPCEVAVKETPSRYLEAFVLNEEQLRGILPNTLSEFPNLSEVFTKNLIVLYWICPLA
jgi:hypothetical protein